MTQSLRISVSVAGVLALLVATGGPAVAAQTAGKCSSAKQKATGKKFSAILSCYSKAAAKAVALDPACVSKADGKFTTAFSKTEAKGGCATTGDSGAIETKVDNCSADINDDLYTSGEDKCASAKIKAAGKKASALLSCYAKAAAKSLAVDPACITKADGKFQQAFAKAEAKGGCNTTGDAGAIETKIDNCTADVADDLNPPVGTTTTTVAGPTTTTTPGPTTTTTTIPGCSCCGSLPSLLSFTTGAPGGGSTGDVQPARCAQGGVGANTGTACATDATCTVGGVCRGHLDKGGLYFGSGPSSGIFLPASIPDLSKSYTKVASCSAGNPVLTHTVAGDIPAGCSVPGGTPSQGSRHCTGAGCLFGSPLPIPNLANPPTSTCIINEIAANATGSATCSTGSTNISLPLTSHVYLTGAVLGTQSCAICTGGTVGVCGSGTCLGGTRNTLACTPETNSLTSHDCPQPSGTFIGDLPIPFNLSTGTQSKTSFSTAAQPRVFCGFCFDPNISSAFANPPDPCTSDGECVARGDDFDSCRQFNNGAFRNAFATTVTETGTDAGACIGDGASHASTLVSVFCIPPSYDPIVDPSGELPGPGAVSLPGTAQFIP